MATNTFSHDIYFLPRGKVDVVYNILALPGADIPIDVAGYVVRVNVRETRIRAIVRVATKQKAPDDIQPLFF